MKGKNLLRKIGIGLPLLGIVLYTVSPKLKFVQYKYQQEIADVFGKSKGLDSTYKHESRETTIILNALSGVINNEELKKLLLQYGYTEDQIKIDSTIKSDIALYKTIWEMNLKYGNPRSTFAGSYKNWETGNQEDKRAHFTPNNAMHLHNIKDLKFSFNNALNDNIMEWNGFSDSGDKIKMGVDAINQELGENRQAYLLNNWIAELAHAKQYNTDGPIRIGMNMSLDYLRSGFDYEDTYDMKRTIENTAHEKFEPELCLEFIEKYKSHADLNNPASLFFIGLLYGGYFEHYTNEDESWKYLRLASEKGSMYASFFLAKKEYKVWRHNQIAIDANGEDLVTGECKLSRDMSEKNALEFFSKAIQQGDHQYSQKFLSTISEVRERYDTAIIYTKQIISYLESLPNRSEDKSYELAMMYRKISNIYRNRAYISVSNSNKSDDKNNEKYLDISNNYFIKGGKLAGSIGRTLPYGPHHAPGTDY